MDFYYLNNSGTGIGLENIAVGNLGSASFALIKGQTIAYKTRADGTMEKGDKDVDAWKLDARWNNIPLWTDGSLDIALIYAWQNLSDAQKENENKQNNGFLAHVEWTQSNILGGFNKLILQYGHDSLDNVGALNGGNHAGGNVQPYGWKPDVFGPTYGAEKGNGYRLIDWGVFDQPSWNLSYVFMMSHKNTFDENRIEGGANWSHPTGNDYAFVIRPGYKWSQFTNTLLEFGYTNQTNTGWNGWATSYKDRVKATKLTLAQEWTPGNNGFWSRPSIRVFASWLSGDLVNKEYTGIKDKNHQITFGAQVEAWW